MSYTKLLYHIIFRTKYGAPTINEENELILYRYIWRFIKEHDCMLYRVNGMPDHIHLFVDLHPSISLANFVQQLKNSTHSYIDENKHLFPDFYAWSKGYCALTYSEKEKEVVINYIKNQKEHHKTKNFKDEILYLFEQNGMQIDTEFFDRNM